MPKLAQHHDQTFIGPEGFHVFRPQCSNCVFRDATNPMRCASFPGGIPLSILRNQFDHRKRHPDDNGITFAPRDTTLSYPLDDFETDVPNSD